MRLAEARVGHVPYSADLGEPGDRRRFAYYARNRGLMVKQAQPSDELDVVMLSTRADITSWCRVDASTKLVYEVIDSYFALPRWGPRNLGRGLAKRLSGETRRLALDYRRAMERMCERADAVVCSTAEQRESILTMCPNVHVILDYHGEDVTSHKVDYSRNGPPKIVWEGLPYTLGSLATIAPILRDLEIESGAGLNLITDLHFHQYTGRVRRRSAGEVANRLLNSYEIHEWSPVTLSEVAIGSDIAVIPANLEDPFSAGKPENKLLLLWRMGLPVVVARTPAYERAMAAVGTPWLACRSQREWRTALRDLIDDEAARRDAGTRGRAFVQDRFSEEKVMSAWDALFESVGFDTSRPSIHHV